MNSGISKTLPVLVQLSEIDSSLARIHAKHKQFDQEIEQERRALDKIRRQYEDTKLDRDKQKSRYQGEEDRIQEENYKLVDRRKVLSTFSNYKVQQAAQKEIELSSKQLSAQEEKLLTTLEEIEALDEQVNTLTEQLEAAETKFTELVASSEGEIEALLERAKEKEATRREMASTIDPIKLTDYERIRKKHPVDPLVPISDGKCGGCYMQVGAQMLVQVSRAKSLVKCRGCGRVLFLAQDSLSEESQKSA